VLLVGVVIALGAKTPWYRVRLALNRGTGWWLNWAGHPSNRNLMNLNLDPVEACIIGSLMEKSMITPDQYPLSLNALVNACNQKSSREPVMKLSEREVQAALEGLQRRYLVREKSGFGGRVPKYHYRLYNDEIGDFRFSAAERAVVCLLLLRGPQTPGELRSRAGRMHEFADTEEVERALQALMNYEQGPFVTRLAREPGRREPRYAQLFTGDTPQPAGGQAASGTGAAGQEEAGEGAGWEDLEVAGADQPEVASSTRERLERLEQRVAALEAALAAISEGRGTGS
jgi:uncharacterized protein YceH (UPF0502 family)